jgi:diguanylate cyclase (GGDEF)-like protein
MVPRHGIVKMIDFGSAIGAALFFVLLVVFAWVTRSADSHLLNSETQIVQSAVHQEISGFESTIRLRTPREWFDSKPEYRAVATWDDALRIHSVGRGLMAQLIEEHQQASALAAAVERRLGALSATTPPELILLHAGRQPVLLMLGTIKGEDKHAFALEMLDIEALARHFLRFGIHDVDIRGVGRGSSDDAAVAIRGADGRAIAEIVWAGARIAPIADRTIVPAIIALGLIAFASLLYIRLRWFEAREQFERELQETHRLAQTDPMTGLPNRRALFEHLARVAPDIGSPKKITVIVLDLDGFKLVNDQFGHHAGDTVIRAAANVFEEVFSGCGMVARMGGDEFVAVVNEILDEDSLQRVYRDVLGRFRERAQRDRFFQRIGVSLGAVHTADHEVGGDELIRMADVALFAAKSRGRGLALLYNPAMRSDEGYTRLLERELRAALLTGELFLEYQPVVDSLSGANLGHEALVRWRHGSRGIISPGQFIPLAEKSDLIIQLGNFVLQRALEELGPVGSGTIAVNVTGRQILSAGFTAHVEACLGRNNVEPARLCLELTETSLVNDADGLVAVMGHLRALGVRFAIDDFGSGYSSLGYLLRFKFDVLKIDKDFISALEDNPESPMIVMSIVSLARSLGMRVVGEGVETPAQHRFLASAGCNALQGFLFGKPAPIAEVVKSAAVQPVKIARIAA